MSCLKCGRDTVTEQVFCADCLLEMQKYPVRPGTVVQLPSQKQHTAVKKQAKRRTIPLEDQVKLLRKRLRTTILLLIIMTLLTAALAVPAAEHLMENHFKIGQNYNTVTTPTEN